MGKWGKLGNIGKFLLPVGSSILAAKGLPIPLDAIIKRRRPRRRRRGSPDHAAIAAGIRDALHAELTDDEVEELDLVAVEFARLAIGERQEDVVEEEEAPPPRRKRRKKTAKTAKKEKK